MRTFALAAFAISLVGSGAAYADALVVGNAKIAPVFANPSGDTSLVVDAGTANRAPVFAVRSGTTGDVIEIGNASTAPVFAEHDRYGVASEARMAAGQSNGAALGNN
jgi:hypothetical protein